MQRKILAAFIAAVFLLMMSSVAWAADSADQTVPEPQQLTLEKAIQRALSNSNALKKADIDVEKADDARTTVSSVYYTNYIPGGEALILAAESTQYAWEAARKTYESQRDTTIINTCDKYFDVLCALEDVKAKEAGLAKAEREYAITQVMWSAGMANKLAADGVQATVAGAKAALTSSQANLENAYASLNQMVGFGENERPVLVDKPGYEPVTTELGVYISRALDDSPTVWTAREAADLKESVQNYDVPAGSGLQAVTDEDAEKADLDADTAEDATRILVRTLYNGIKGIEEAYAAADQGAQIAAENLRIAQLKFDLGMATKRDLATAEASLADAQKQLFDLTVQHAYMKLALEKPWAYLAAMGSSGSGP